MAEIGTAYLNVVPKFPGFGQSVDAAMQQAGGGAGKAGGAIGAAMGKGMGTGFAKAGAVAGIVSSVSSKVMGAVSSQVGAAVSRFDTLNRYPRVMESMGYSAAAASESINKMSDRLQGLPTTLDTMVSTVQGLTATMGDMDKATDVGLALNDMLVAGGAGVQATASSMQQFQQILAKGKPDLQDWRILVQAMPGQMDALAKSMLGPTANANDLYMAVGGGDQKKYDGPRKSLDELTDAMVRLDKEGGEGFESFQKQAEKGAGGINTAFSNMRNAITRGLADMFDQLGEDRIVGWIDGVKGGIRDAFAAVNDEFGGVVPVIESIASAIGDAFKDMAPGAQRALEGVADFVRGAWDAIAPYVPQFAEFGGKLLETFGGLASQAGPYVGIVANALGGLAETATNLLDAVEPILPAVVLAVGGFKLFNGVKGPIDGIVGGLGTVLGKLGETDGLVGTVASSIVTKLGGTGPAAAAIVGAGALIGIGVAAWADWKRGVEDVEAATVGMDQNISRLTGLQGYSESIQESFSGAKDAVMEMGEVYEENAEKSKKISQVIEDTESYMAQLSNAKKVIEQYAGQSDLSADAQGRLQWALKLVNDELDLNITQQDVATGKYTAQDGSVRDLCKSLDELIEKKRLEARMDALSSSLTDAYEMQSNAAKGVAGAERDMDQAHSDFMASFSKSPEMFGKSADEIARLGEEAWAASPAFEHYSGKVKEAQGYYNDTTRDVKQLEHELGVTQSVLDGTADAWTKLGEGMKEQDALFAEIMNSNGRSATDLAHTLTDLGLTTEQVSGLSATELQELARSYDGSVGSVLDVLDSWENKERQGKVNHGQAVQGIKEQLQELGPAYEQALGGIDMGALAQSMEEAGMKTGTLADIGSDNLGRLAAACGYDVDLMVAALQNYNGTELVDKDGNVHVNDVELKDANGEVFVWNGTTLVNKKTGAKVDQAELVTANGNVLVWNGSQLVPKNGSVTIADNGLSSANRGIGTYRSYPDNLGNKTGSVTITHNIQNVVSTIKKEMTVRGAGNAAGGFRMHADGAIVNAPVKGYPLDLVGEDGAEAIVPLTNRRYAMPFVKMIADEIGNKSAGGVTYNINIDGLRVNDDAAMQRTAVAFVQELQRRGAAYR